MSKWLTDKKQDTFNRPEAKEIKINFDSEEMQQGAEKMQKDLETQAAIQKFSQTQQDTAQQPLQIKSMELQKPYTQFYREYNDDGSYQTHKKEVTIQAKIEASRLKRTTYSLQDTKQITTVFHAVQESFQKSSVAGTNMESLLKIAQKIIASGVKNDLSGLNDVDRDYMNYYIEISTEKNVESYLSSKEAGAIPDRIRARLLGSLIKQTESQAFKQNLTSTLNKYTDHQQSELLAEILLLLNDIKSEKEEAIKMVVSELFEKACIEVKFVRLYVDVLLDLVQTNNNQFINNYQESLTNNYITNCKSKKAKPTFQDKFCYLITTSLVNDRIRNEITEQKPVDQRFDITEDDKKDAAVLETKQNNVNVHRAGCIGFLTQLFLRDSQNRLLKTEVYVSCLVFMLKNDLVEIQKNVSVPDNEKKQHPIYSVTDLQNADMQKQGVKKLASSSEFWFNKQGQINATFIKQLLISLVKAKDHLELKLSQEKGTAVFVYEYLKEVISRFNEKHLEAYIYYQVKLLRGEVNMTKQEQQKVGVVDAAIKKQKQFSLNQESFKELVGEWQEQGLKLEEIFATVCRTTADKIWDKFKDLKIDGKYIITFCDLCFRHNYHEKLCQKLLVFVNCTMKVKQQKQDFVSELFNTFLKHYSEDGSYQQTFQMFARFSLSEFHFLKEMFAFVDRIPLPDSDTLEFEQYKQKVRTYKCIFVNIMHAIIQHSMLSSLEDLSEYLESEEIELLSSLIQQRKYGEINKQPFYLKCLVQNDIAPYFNCPDSQKVAHLLPTHFEKCANDALKTALLRDIEVSTDTQSELLRLLRFISQTLFDCPSNEKIPRQFINIFNELGYPCGIQVLSFIRYREVGDDAHYCLCFIQNNIEKIMNAPNSAEFDQSGYEKDTFVPPTYVAAAVLDFAFAIYKDIGSSGANKFISTLKVLKHKMDTKQVKDLVLAKAKSKSGYGAIDDLVKFVDRY